MSVQPVQPPRLQPCRMTGTNGGRRLPDLHDSCGSAITRKPGILADRWPIPVQRRHPPGRPRERRSRFDYRRPKHPYSDKFMLAADCCAPTCYALWIMGEASANTSQPGSPLLRRPDIAMLSVDALIRRGARAEDSAGRSGLADHPMFAQAKGGESGRSRAHRIHGCPTTSAADHQASASPPPPEGHSGHCRRINGIAENRGVRRRIRDVRRARAGTEDPGVALQTGKAPALFLGQQRRHRRCAARRRGA